MVFHESLADVMLCKCDTMPHTHTHTKRDISNSDGKNEVFVGIDSPIPNSEVFWNQYPESEQELIPKSAPESAPESVPESVLELESAPESESVSDSELPPKS